MGLFFLSPNFQGNIYVSLPYRVKDENFLSPNGLFIIPKGRQNTLGDCQCLSPLVTRIGMAEGLELTNLSRRPETAA